MLYGRGYDDFVPRYAVASATLSIEQDAHLKEICEEMITAYDRCFKSERARDIIRRRFGLGVPPQTAKDIGTVYGISRGYTHHIILRFQLGIRTFRQFRPHLEFLVRIFSDAGVPFGPLVHK